MNLEKKKIGGQTEFISRPNVFETRTEEIPKSLGVKQEDGRSVVPAGTIFPSNDANAVGFVVNDIDVTLSAQPGAIIDRGYVYKDRLPVEMTPEAEAALKNHFIFD